MTFPERVCRFTIRAAEIWLRAKWALCPLIQPPHTMNGPNIRLALLCAGLAALPSAVFSQPATQADPASTRNDEVVQLPEFVITETPDNPYISKRALSASRVAMNLQDIPQTVSVVTSEFLKDSQSFRMLDAAKYVTPIVESTLPYGGDRYMIRGFQVSHEFVDGAEISGQDGYSMSLAPYNIERVEIIKGPNAILVPGGSPGGQMNPITKSPIMKDQASVTLDLGQYFTNAVSTDVNRVLTKKIAARFVAAYWDSDGYAKNQFRAGYLFAPSLSWQLSPTNKLVVKAEFMQNRETNLGGLPLDPSIGSDGYAIIAKGLPRDWSFGGDDGFDARHRATERITMELFSELGEHVSSRLQLMANHVTREDAGGTSGAILGTSGSRNPNTGKYEPGVLWTLDQTGPTAVATSTVTPLPDPSTYVYSRSYGAVDLWYSEAHLRNEYAAKFDTSYVKSTTVAGFASNFSKVQFKSYEAVARPNVANNNLGAITNPRLTYLEPALTNTGGNRTGKQEDLQVFVYENASFLQDRLQLSAGVSRFFGQLTRVDSTGLLRQHLSVVQSVRHGEDVRHRGEADQGGVLVLRLQQFGRHHARLAQPRHLRAELSRGGGKAEGVWRQGLHAGRQADRVALALRHRATELLGAEQRLLHAHRARQTRRSGGTAESALSQPGLEGMGV